MKAYVKLPQCPVLLCGFSSRFLILACSSSRWVAFGSDRVVAFFFVKKRSILAGVVAGDAGGLEAHVLVLNDLLVVGPSYLLYLQF